MKERTGRLGAEASPDTLTERDAALDEAPREGDGRAAGADGAEPGDEIGIAPEASIGRDSSVGRELARSPIPAHGDEVVPPTGQATGAGGGYGIGSGRGSSGGSGDATDASIPAGTDPETQWLRGETTGDGR